MQTASAARNSYECAGNGCAAGVEHCSMKRCQWRGGLRRYVPLRIERRDQQDSKAQDAELQSHFINFATTTFERTSTTKTQFPERSRRWADAQVPMRNKSKAERGKVDQINLPPPAKKGHAVQSINIRILRIEVSHGGAGAGSDFAGTGIELGYYSLRMNASASLRFGNCASSALNSAEWTQRRRPRIRTGCFKCSISWYSRYSIA